jgi:hypothetical protein
LRPDNALLRTTLELKTLDLGPYSFNEKNIKIYQNNLNKKKG